jgi:hypothetical protein
MEYLRLAAKEDPTAAQVLGAFEQATKGGNHDE